MFISCSLSAHARMALPICSTCETHLSCPMVKRVAMAVLVLACLLSLVPGQLLSQSVSPDPSITTVTGNGTHGHGGFNQTARVVSPIRSSQADPKIQAKILDAYGNLPLNFEINQGQIDPRVKFLSRGGGYTLFLTENEAVLSLQKKAGVMPTFRGARPGLKPGASTSFDKPTTDEGAWTTSAVLRMRLVGANVNAAVTGAEQLPGRSNYFIGNEPQKWRTNVPNYAKVRFQGVYPGVDLVYYGNQGRGLEYDFVVAPGADPSVIALEVGADSVRPAKGERRSTLRIAADGDVVVKIDGGEVRFQKPVVYQPTTGDPKSQTQNRELLDGRYVLLAGNRVGFEIPNYDKTKPLVIDPALSYSTYLGGSGVEGGTGSVSIAVDASGNAYVASGTASTNFPVTYGAFQMTFGGAPAVCPQTWACGDAVVAKVDPTGSTLIYSTYLGGSGDDDAYGLAVDSAGNAYVTGVTNSPNFPTAPNNAYQTSLLGGYDIFVTKLNPTGSGLVYSTYLGGSNDETVQALAIDSYGDAYVAGGSSSPDFPTTSGAYDTTFSSQKAGALVCGSVQTPEPCPYAIVTELNPAGTALIYSTFLGGSGSDSAGGLAVDSSGAAYVTGWTNSTNFPKTAGAFQSSLTAIPCGTSPNTWQCPNAFFTKLNPQGKGLADLVYSTYLGGTGNEYTLSAAVDSLGNAYIVGLTSSNDFPTTTGAFQTTHAGPPITAGCNVWTGCAHAFVSKINPANSGSTSLVYSTYLSGSATDLGCGITVDSSGNAYVTGWTDSPDFPMLHPTQAVNAGGYDAYITELNAAGSGLISSTYLGGSGNDLGDSIAVDSSGNVYVGGWTESANFPTTPGSVQPLFGGARDLFVAKILPLVSVSSTSLTFGPQDVGTTTSSQTLTLTNNGTGSMSFNITTTPGFSENDNCGSTLAADASCTITITSTPTDVGTQVGQLIISGAPGGPVVVSLTVQGILTPGNIATLVGGGRNSTVPLSAYVAAPNSTAIDKAGNIYVSLEQLSQVYKITPSGSFILVAGTGVAGFSGDGGPATTATLGAPGAVAVDASGNLYIADRYNLCIRKVIVSTGIITTVAGKGGAWPPSYSGDGGLATSASLNAPSGLAFDASGNLFIADSGNNVIRRVDGTSGIITTVAGTGVAGYNGDNRSATSATLNMGTYRSQQIALDSSGNLYIADTNNNRIRKVTGGVITTVAGNGTEGLYGDGGPAPSAILAAPEGVALDANGNIFFGDNYSRIRAVNMHGTGITVAGVAIGPGDIATVAGGFGGFRGDGGPATSAGFASPTGVAIDASGDILIADLVNNRVRIVAASSGIVTTLAGGGSGGDGGLATSAIAASPITGAVDNFGDLYFLETTGNRVRRVDGSSGIITTVAGNTTGGFNGDGVAATSASLDGPSGMTLDSSGNIFIADSYNWRIRRVDASTGMITTVAGNGSPGFSGDNGSATSAQLDVPFAVAVDATGNLFIADWLNHRIRVVNMQGAEIIVAGVAIEPGYIATVAGNGTAGYSSDGVLASNTSLDFPTGVAVDGSGNFFILDAGNQRIRRVDAITGYITTFAGNGTAGFSGDGGPATSACLNLSIWNAGISLDSAGNLFIADSGNVRIRRVDAATGIITTVAGGGPWLLPSIGDGGPALSAILNNPAGVAVDSSGHLFIADNGNNRIREAALTPSVILSTTALTFADQLVGTSSPWQTVTVTSAGGLALTITSIVANGDYAQTNTCPISPSTLDPGSTCTISVGFTPTAAGTRAGTLTIIDNSNGVAGSTQTVDLSGTGMQSQTITFPNPGAQTYGVGPLSLTATATSGLLVSYTVLSGPATVSGNTLTITGAGSVSVQATQAGNATWAAATPVPVTFIVNPATLTFAAYNQFMGAGSIGTPLLTYAYYGLVNGDTPTSVGLSGSPSLSTWTTTQPPSAITITSATSPGMYTILIQPGSLVLTSPNYALAFVNGTLTVSPNALNFMDNYFVTGDYSAAGVDLHAVTPVSGMVTGTISIAGVPAGADIVNAFLYWQTAENPSSSPSGQAVFNGYAIIGNVLGSDLPLMGLSWGPLGGLVMRSYRAEVYPLLPRDPNTGIYQPAGPHTVTLLAPAQGASLVVIYRMLPGGPGAGPQPSQYPLKAVVIQDGAWLPANSSQSMTQTIQGYYDGVIFASANVTSIYSTQSGWIHALNQKILESPDGSQYTDYEPTGAWSALIFSVPVNSSDNDGLLDVWKKNGGYCDAGVNQGICNPGDPSWVDLTGATHGEKDLFVQMDYMCSGVVSIGSNGVPVCDTSGGGHSHLPWTMIQPTMTQNAFLTMVQQPFLARGINVHFVAGNAVPEETCTTDDPVDNLFCMWPGEPGVVGWKGGLEQIKASPRNRNLCNAGGDCTPRFQIGKKDSYHYVLLGHSVSIPSWSIQAGTLSNIRVLSGGWLVVTTTARLPDAYGNIPCPTRVTIDGALATPGLNGVYNVLAMPPATTACPSSTTFTIQTASLNPTAYPVASGTFPVPNGLPEPALAIYSSQTDSTSGYSDVGGGDSTVTLGKFDPTQAELANVQAGSFMHELGHTLGLTHGGRYYPNGNVPLYEPNCKPNHQSVMNYLFQFDLLGLPDSAHPYGYLDYSDRALSSLDESNLSPWPGLVAPEFPTETKWFSSSQPPNSATSVATNCDGTPVGSTQSPMWVWDGIPDWVVGSSQDINFDQLISVLDGYSDWDSTDLRQVGAFATDYVDVASLLGNGGGHGATGIGGGGHGATGIGGGKHFSELNYETADSYPRPPRALTMSSGTLTWYAASFGKIQQYNIYSVTNGSPALIACIIIAPPGNCPIGVPQQPGSPNALTYSYTVGTSTGSVTYFVTTVDIGPSGAVRESTPARQQQAALNLNPTSSLTYGSSETLSTTGGTTGGLETYYVLSGPCSITQVNQQTANLTANSGTGSCQITATMAGSSSYDPVTSSPVVVNLRLANPRITVTPYNVTYDGNPHTATGAAIGVKSELLSGLNLTATTHTVVGTYTDPWTFTDVTGNYNNVSGTVVDSINPSSTATALSGTPNPANFGQSVSLTAKVAPVSPGAGTPTGTLTFKDGGTALTTVTMSNASAAFTTSSLAPGTHSLSASYSGDANFIKSSSAALAEQVVCGLLVGISPSTMHWGGTVTVSGQLISCSSTSQTVVVKFTLNATFQPNKCGSAQSVIFTSPPITLPAKTSKTVSFNFVIPSGTCTGKYSITAATLVNGTVVNSSTASLTVTAH